MVPEIKIEGKIFKTHFMYLTSSQKAAAVNLSEPVLLGNDLIEPSKKKRILGVTVSSTFSMKYHLTEGEDSLVKKVGVKMRALWKLKDKLSFKARRATAYGLVVSRLMFSI